MSNLKAPSFFLLFLLPPLLGSGQSYNSFTMNSPVGLRLTSSAGLPLLVMDTVKHAGMRVQFHLDDIPPTEVRESAYLSRLSKSFTGFVDDASQLIGNLSYWTLRKGKAHYYVNLFTQSAGMDFDLNSRLALKTRMELLRQGATNVRLTWLLDSGRKSRKTCGTNTGMWAQYPPSSIPALAPQSAAPVPPSALQTPAQ
jgi:hypothetical protein